MERTWPSYSPPHRGMLSGKIFIYPLTQFRSEKHALSSSSIELISVPWVLRAPRAVRNFQHQVSSPVGRSWASWLCRCQQRSRSFSIPRIAVRLMIAAKLCQFLPMMEKELLRKKGCRELVCWLLDCLGPRRPRKSSRLPRLYT